MCYLIEGKGSRDFANAKSFIYNNKQLAIELAQFLSEQICHYLVEMIRAGCDAIQLFDSWAGVLTGQEYSDFVVKPNKIITSLLKDSFPDIPVIAMPKGSSFNYYEFAENVPADILSVDQYMPPLLMQSFQDDFIVQGNLDPAVLLSNKDTIAIKIDEIFATLDKRKYIFNLGHGILPNTPIENVEFAIEYVRSK